MHNYCRQCKQNKAEDEFFSLWPDGQRRRSALCNSCTDANKTKTRKQIQQYGTKYRQSVRAKVIAAYGGACACCGETEPLFLAVDHINNDGAARRRELNMKGGSGFNSWIIKNNFPDTLQLLCHNCNCAKGYYGRCPHETN